MHEEFCINCYKIILKKGIYCKKLLSPLARAEWIEIRDPPKADKREKVSARESGVD